MTSSSSHREASTSASLIRRVQNNDRAAWERLSVVYGPVVYEWARQHGLQPQDAADVMQDVFQTLTRNVGKFDLDRGTPFRGWLWTVTRNKVNDLYRKQADRARAEGGTEALHRMNQMPAEMADAPPISDSDIGQSESSGVYRRAMDLIKTDFEPQTWQAFWRTVVNREKPTEVAADLGISKWAIYKARSRVMQRLREEFADLM